MRTFIILFLIYLPINLFVFLTIWKLFKGRKGLRMALSAVFGSELIIFLAGLLFDDYLSVKIVHSFHMMSMSWLLFLFYTTGLLLIGELIYLIARNRRPGSSRNTRWSQKVRIRMFFSIVMVVIAIMAHGNYKFNHPVVQQIEINIDKPARNIDSIRIAMIGDLHLGYLIDRDHAKRMVDLIMAQEPELILFTGDIIDSHFDPMIRQRMDEELRRLHAPLGVYSCTGNHEYLYEVEEKIQWLNDAGITMLRDSAVLIDSAFYVVGREDMVVPSRLPLPQILHEQNVDMSKPVIILNHTPSDLDQEVNAGADIALYGHTHNGQFFPGNIITKILFEVAHGYKKKEHTHIYVTSGIGLAGPQYRIGTVSEMAVLNVVFSN